MSKLAGPLAALALSMALWGCDDGIGNCDPGIELCDVHERSCQEHIFEATACQRRQKAGEFPEIRSITKREFAEELAAEGGPPGPKDAWDIALGLLELINPDAGTGQSTSEALVDGVLAFYDPRTKQVTLLSDATKLSRKGEVLVLSHEFVHVLQDRDVGMLRFDRATSTDGYVANDAATEGEAVFHSNAAVDLGDDIIPEERNWDGYYEGTLAGIFQGMDDTSSPLIQATLNLPYPVGGAFVTDAWLDDGQPALDRLYRNDHRVRVFADWQQGYPQGLDAPRPRLDCDPPEGPAGYELYGNDVFGVAGVAALWAARDAGAERGWEQARDWRGGRTWLYAKGGDEDSEPEGVVLIWQTRWRSADGAQAVADLYDAEDDAVVFLDDEAAAIVVTSDEATLPWIERNVDDWLHCEDMQNKGLHKGLDSLEAPPRGQPWWPDDPRQWSMHSMAATAR